jgi:methionyl-tRNA formyltransferase
LKIALFLNRDLESNLAYNLLKPELTKHSVIIYYTDTVGNDANKPESLTRLEYFEKQYIYQELTQFIEASGIKPSFEFLDDSFSTFPLQKAGNINSETFIDEMSEYNPDLFVSIRFGKIFKDEIIKIPTNGLINLHSGILPNYRGIMGTLHAINNGDEKIGCTLHTIPNGEIDTGEIIEIAETAVNRNKSLFWNIMSLYPIGAELIRKAIVSIEHGERPLSYPQDFSIGKYYSVPTANDFEKLNNNGMEAINLSDYQELITETILGDLSNTEKTQLRNFIAKAFSD